MCQLGGQDNWLKRMINTLAKMTHHIRTAYGNSSQGQNHKDWVEPITGIRQGNRVGPQIWVAISTVLFNIMREDGMFASIVSAISHQKLDISGFVFVDDTDLIMTHAQGDTDNIQTKIQKSVTNWEGLLKATRGTLVPEKCFWYAIKFQWSNNKWTYMNQEQAPAKLMVQDETGQPVTIPHLKLSKACRTLGVRLAPDGNNGRRSKVPYTSDLRVGGNCKKQTIPGSHRLLPLIGSVLQAHLPSDINDFY